MGADKTRSSQLLTSEGTTSRPPPLLSELIQLVQLSSLTAPTAAHSHRLPAVNSVNFDRSELIQEYQLTVLLVNIPSSFQ